ncbi:MAG: GPW/gp25 family protein [Dehalococcoidia bacterium]
MAIDNTSQPRAFLGRGWAFPVTLEGSGDVGMVSLEEDIRQSVRVILETDQGERVMRPDFGAGLRALAFEPISSATMALVRHRVDEALITWEPRIDTITVAVRAEPAAGRLLVDIHYRVRITNTFYNLVYPFYLMEGRV